MIENGVPITLGTDFPVASINPLETFYAAITRLSLKGDSPNGPDGWFPEQRLTREEALKGKSIPFLKILSIYLSLLGMTLDAAHATFTETTTGSLTPGKRADYTVLSKDIMVIPPPEILKTKVLATALDGKVVYGKL